MNKQDPEVEWSVQKVQVGHNKTQVMLKQSDQQTDPDMLKKKLQTKTWY